MVQARQVKYLDATVEDPGDLRPDLPETEKGA